MTDGQIPVNPEDYNLFETPLDESSIYVTTLDKVTLSPKRDKNGYCYCAIQVIVADGDFEGKTVTMNYLPLLVPFEPGMSKREMIAAQDKSAVFARFAKAYKVGGPIAYVTDPTDPEQRERFTEWMSKYIGNTGKVTVVMNEFPVGSGRRRPNINDFVF